MRKLDRWKPRQVLRFNRTLDAAALVLLVLAVVMRVLCGPGAVWPSVLCVLALLLMAAGWAAAAARLRCPCCGASLLGKGGKIPSRLPDYCPHCGRPVAWMDE